MKSASEIKSMMDMVKSAEEQYKTLREFDRILVEETYGFKLEEIEERLDGVTMESLYNLPVEEINEIFKSGLSFLEVGGITPKPQPGNPSPRMFRLYEDEGIINRFGLKNTVDLIGKMTALETIMEEEMENE